MPGGWHRRNLRRDEGPTRGLSSLPLPHKGLGYPIGWGWRGRGPPEEEERPFSKTPPLWASAPPGRGPGSRPSSGLDLLSEDGNPPHLSGLSFPHWVIPGIFPQPAVPFLVSALSYPLQPPTGPPWARDPASAPGLGRAQPPNPEPCPLPPGQREPSECLPAPPRRSRRVPGCGCPPRSWSWTGQGPAIANCVLDASVSLSGPLCL